MDPSGSNYDDPVPVFPGTRIGKTMDPLSLIGQRRTYNSSSSFDNKRTINIEIFQSFQPNNNTDHDPITR